MVLVRKGVEFNLLETKNGFAKIIRVDDVEHRAKLKQAYKENEIFNMFYKVIQNNILRKLDEPQYIYVPENKLNKLFKKF